MICAVPEAPCASALKVIGVGGCGKNAVNSLIQGGLAGIGFIAANTDSAGLAKSLADHKIRLGGDFANAFGAKNNPASGCLASFESMEQIKAALSGASVVVIVAGMGGGAGTGAVHAIAQAAKKMGALTVGIVTTPFAFEGKKRQENAEAGIAALREHLDSLVIISNDGLLALAPEGSSLPFLFGKANEILLSAFKGIADLIVAKEPDLFLRGEAPATVGEKPRSTSKISCDEVKAGLANLACAYGAPITVSGHDSANDNANTGAQSNIAG